MLAVRGLESLRQPSGWKLGLTTAGMVALVNSVMVGTCAGVLLAMLGDASLTLAAGAVVGAAALSLQHRHHRHAGDRSFGSPYPGLGRARGHRRAA